MTNFTKKLTKGQLETNARIVAAIAGMIECFPAALVSGAGFTGLAHAVNSALSDDDPVLGKPPAPVTKEMMRKASRAALRKLGYQRLDVEIFIKVQR